MVTQYMMLIPDSAVLQRNYELIEKHWMETWDFMKPWTHAILDSMLALG
jgi:hypothetical protein